MANRNSTFLLKRSNVIDKVPNLTGLTIGELALNTADAKLYTIFTSGTTGGTEVRQIGWDRVSKTGDTITGNLNIIGDLSTERITEQIYVGENVVYGDLLFLSGDSFYYKASNVSESTSSTELRIALDTILSGYSGTGLIKGQISGTVVTGENYIVGSVGNYTTTQPIADGSIIRHVGTALSSTILEFNPDQTYLEISSGIPVEPPNCIPDLYVSNLHSCSPLHINPINSEGDVLIGENGGVNVGIGTLTPTSLLDVAGQIKATTLEVDTINADTINIVTTITGLEIASVNGLQDALDDKATTTSLSIHTSDYNNPHQTSFNNLTSTAHTHTISDVNLLQDSLDLKTDLSLFNSHTGNTNNPHQTSFDNLSSTAHTHTTSDISDLNTQLNNKFDKSGGTITGSVTINANFTVLGSATTVNTQTLNVVDNVVILNSNLTGSTDEPFFGDSGLNVLRGSGSTSVLIWNETNDKWYAGLSGSTKQLILSGDSLSLLNSGHTHTIAEIDNLQTTLTNKLNTSGGTISGSISATTISATTFYGNGSNLTGIITTDYYVTGGTFSGTTLTLKRNGLSDVTITGFTSTGNYLSLSGGTVSGNTTFTTGVTLSSLTGTTDRMVEVNSSGNVSAGRVIISAYLTGGTITTNLVNASNWASKNYIGPSITGTYQGQKYYDGDYFFEAVADNVWIRLSRV